MLTFGCSTTKNVVDFRRDLCEFHVCMCSVHEKLLYWCFACVSDGATIIVENFNIKCMEKIQYKRSIAKEYTYTNIIL